MSLLFSMLPIYLFGNLHCAGMCGPLVMMIGRHRFRYFYFLGRLLSFSLAGLLAGEAGAVLNVFLKQYQITALTSFIFGGFIIVIGIFTLLGWQYPGYVWLSKRMAKTSQNLSFLMLKDKAWPSFLFGFFTLALPCGQTLLVFSACALTGSLFAGLLNGFMFALLTSPSLFLAMHAHSLLKGVKKYYSMIIGYSALFIGLLAILRGLADLGVINHLILNPQTASHYHIVIF